MGNGFLQAGDLEIGGRRLANGESQRGKSAHGAFGRAVEVLGHDEADQDEEVKMLLHLDGARGGGRRLGVMRGGGEEEGEEARLWRDFGRGGGRIQACHFDRGGRPWVRCGAAGFGCDVCGPVCILHKGRQPDLFVVNM